jgi:hypothetical protein
MFRFLDLHQTYDTKKKIIRIFFVGFNGNNTITYFTNTCNGFQVLKQKLAIAIIWHSSLPIHIC